MAGNSSGEEYYQNSVGNAGKVLDERNSQIDVKGSRGPETEQGNNQVEERKAQGAKSTAPKWFRCQNCLRDEEVS